jgi:5'(3')-deoxyribonucleotidase
MRIGLDVDGCLYPWTKAVNQALLEKFGIKDLIDHPSWDYLHDTINSEQWRWIWSEEAAPYVFLRLDLIYEGAANVVNSLCHNHEVHFVTHRNPRILTAITGAWLSEYFRNYCGVHVLDNSIAKTTIYNWDLFIDDKPQTISEFNEADIRIEFPTRPWNSELLGGFNSWEELLDRV